MSKKCTCSNSRNFINENALMKHTRKDRKKISEEELDFMLKTTSSQIDTNSIFVLEKIFNPNFLKVIMKYLER